MDDGHSPPSSLPRASQTSLQSFISSNASDKENASPTRRKPRTSQSHSPASKLDRSPSHATRRPPNGASSSEDEAEPRQEGNAYERVRMRLLGLQDDARNSASTSGAASVSVAPTRISTRSVGEDYDDADEEEDDVAVAPRRVGMAGRMRNGASPPPSARSDAFRSRGRKDGPGAASRQDVSASRESSPAVDIDDLFGSPTKAAGSQDGEDAPGELGHGLEKPASKLEALVARKREERLAAEREAARSAPSSGDELPSTKPHQKAKKSGRAGKPAASGPASRSSQRPVEVESEGDSDKEVSGRLAQQSRPTRKAGKKALEEMARETQRMSRSMQLAHLAKTKSKFTTDDLFKRFNFRQTKPAAAEPAGSSSPTRSSDLDRLGGGTPPSSPPSAGESAAKTNAEASALQAAQGQAQEASDSEDDLQAIMDAVRFEKTTKTAPAPLDEQSPRERISAKKFMKTASRPITSTSEDDELDILPAKHSVLTFKRPLKPSRIAILDQQDKSQVPNHSNTTILRALANVHEHGPATKRGGPRPSHPSELSARLRQKARQQGALERAEKIEALKAKGIFVQSAEEKERDQLAVEDMLDKARKEADEIAKREKEAAKREGRETNDGLDDSEDEDEEYVGSDEEHLALSGSDEEGEDEGEESDLHDGDDAETGNPIFDDEADEGDDEDENEGLPAAQEDATDGGSEAEQDDEADVRVRPSNSRRKRKTLVESDDEDGEPSRAPVPTLAATPNRSIRPILTPKSASTVAAFGFNQTKPLGLGLSQMFAGTMAESQDDNDSQVLAPVAMDSQQDSLDYLRGMAAPPPPTFGARTPAALRVGGTPVSQTQVTESQPDYPQGGVLNFETQTQLPAYEDSQTNSPATEATQDQGFATFMSPLAARTAAPLGTYSTVPTMPLSKTQDSPKTSESPARKRGRMRRRQMSASSSPTAPSIGQQDELLPFSEDSDVGNDDYEISGDAFHIMHKASRKKREAATYDKKNSKAAEMVQEQAEESEDEYAGLGGVSEDEDGADADGETQKMIDDESREKMNERKLAAMHAERELAENEKGVEKLYKDIVNGGLRRKRGAEMELWDSDDEDEAARRRRAAKQRDFAKMRRELLKDEGVAKIAENPKQSAFLAALEDRPEDDDIFQLDERPLADNELSQSQSQSDSQKQDRSDADAAASIKITQAPGVSRRTSHFTQPTSLAGIRDTLSELIGEPVSVLDSQPDMLLDAAPGPDDTTEDEYDEDDDFVVRDSPKPESAGPASDDMAAPAPPPPNTIRPVVIDRRSIAARRSASRHLPANQTRLAFQSVSSLSASRAPSLLKRATTNASNVSTDSAGALGGMGKEVVKMGGTKRSSVNFQVRQAEKRRRVEGDEEERRRRDVGRARGRRGVELGVEGGMFE